MRAAVFREMGKRLEIVDLDLEDPRAGEVKIDVAASGICRSDLSVTTGTLRSPLPVVLGHEAAGIVTQLGEGVEHLELGDHVIVSLTPACGDCLFCNEGAPNRCIKMVPGMIGSTMIDGTTRLKHGNQIVYQLCGIASFAEEAVVCAQSCIQIPHHVPLDRACLLGCGVLTGAGSVFNSSDIREGTSVAVIGCGGVGLSAIQAARIVGASPIVAIDIDPEKLTLAEQLGATHAIDGRSDVRETVRKLTGLGVHVAIEAIGTSATIETAWEILRPGGLALVIGMPPGREKIPIRAGGLFLERRLAGSVYGGANPHEDIPRLLDYLERGEFHLDSLVSEELPLDDVADALEALAAGKGARHVIVNPR